MPQKYFIAYSGNNRRGNHVVGHAEITRLKPIAGIQDIFGIAEDICKSQNLANCAISGWQPFEDQPAPVGEWYIAHLNQPGGQCIGFYDHKNNLILQKRGVTVAEAQEIAVAFGKELIHS